MLQCTRFSALFEGLSEGVETVVARDVDGAYDDEGGPQSEVDACETCQRSN